MKAAIYASVSKDDGSQSTESQLSKLRRFAVWRNWMICRDFTDQASGARLDRDQFQEMLKGPSKRKFDAWIAWAGDRLIRKWAQSTIRYLQMLDGCGNASRKHVHRDSPVFLAALRFLRRMGSGSTAEHGCVDGAK